ncbi:MAG: protease B nonderepressible form [Bathelium mastoideum]|nr:MAG: protease B nonderepressible form [Bathelium mastoideum]
MKQRITYLLQDIDRELDLDQVQVDAKSLTVDGIASAKELRTTFGFDEVPRELWVVLKQCHELRIRWASSRPYTAVPPLVSRVSPGLHVYYTPRQSGKDVPLCSWLQRLFGNELDCKNVERSFINLPILSERFSSTASLQYYFLLPSLERFVTYLQHTVHESQRSNLSSLLHADYLDIDCDIIAHACVLNAYWSESPGSKPWKERIVSNSETGIIEVGILTNEKSLEAEELSFNGVLTVIGEDGKPKPTRFSFPSRHHPIPPLSAYHAHIALPAGLHPTLKLTFHHSLRPPQAACALHAHLTLPRHFFLDRHQLRDPLFLASQNLQVLHALAGATDLEAPDWAVSQWGSAALLELAPPTPPDSPTAADSSTAGTVGEWTASIPLHLRYASPSPNETSQEAQLPWPVVFWACAADEGMQVAGNPFDRTNVGFDGLFGPRTLFYHIPPLNGKGMAGGEREMLVERVAMPVLSLDRAWYVEWGTLGAVVLGWVWLVWKLVDIGMGWRGKGGGNGEKEE